MAAERDQMTFDELTSAYRVESRSASLSEVRKDLYPALAALSARIQKEYETELSKDPGSIICEGVNERRKKILLYSHKIVDQRMDKIARLALSGAMGADNATDHLTAEEKDYYRSVLELSKGHRSLIDRKTARATVLNVGQEPVTDVILRAPEPIQEDAAGEADAEGPGTEGEEGSMVVRVLEDLPVFSGPDRDYDLRKEDVVRMPSVMAMALISREKAVRVDLTP